MVLEGGSQLTRKYTDLEEHLLVESVAALLHGSAVAIFQRIERGQQQRLHWRTAHVHELGNQFSSAFVVRGVAGGVRVSHEQVLCLHRGTEEEKEGQVHVVQTVWMVTYCIPI